MAYVPLAAALLVLARGRRGIGPALALVAGLVVAVAPWCVRNSFLYGHPMGIADIWLHNLIEHNPDDRWVSSEGQDVDTREGRRAYYGRVARANREGDLGRRGSEILAGTLRRMVAEPGRAARRFGRNAAASVAPFPSRHLEAVLGTRTTCGVRLWTDLTTLVNGLALVLAGLGLVDAVRRRASWPVLSWLPLNFVAICLLFAPQPRYVYTVAPVLAVLAGAGCGTLRRLAVRWLGRRTAGPTPPHHHGT